MNNMETRNIKLTLEKAREFYNKGGEFRDLALSAFSEEEILVQKLPKTWEEFCSKRKLGDSACYITPTSEIVQKTYGFCDMDTNRDKNICHSIADAKAHLALMQLHQLRDCYRQGWVPDCSTTEHKYSIVRFESKIRAELLFRYNRFLSFQTKELAQQFLNNFRELIEQAGDLI